MFSKRRPVLFISKNYIETGWVATSREVVFEGGETLSYSLDTLSAQLERIQSDTRESLHIVLSEELVYVTALSFPRGAEVTRNNVQEVAEASIPEDLQQTMWDFRTMRFREHAKKSNETLVQVVVVEQDFAKKLDQALQSGVCHAEIILPESYILALFEEKYEGMTLIVEEDRESTIIAGVSQGLVVGTVVKPGVLSDGIVIVDAIKFLEDVSGERITRIVGSHLTNQNLLSEFDNQGYIIERRDYNPLLGVFLGKKWGRDENILNLSSDSGTTDSWWQRLVTRRR